MLSGFVRALFAKTDDLPVARTDELAVVTLYLRRGHETIEVEIARTSTPLSRHWATATTRLSPALPAFVGRGFATGPTLTVDTGSEVIRATYDDGRDISGLAPREQEARMRRTEEKMKVMLGSLE